MLLTRASSLLALAIAIGLGSIANAQTFSKTFSTASGTADLEVVNQSGSIKILPGGAANKVVITGKPGEGDPKIGASQTSEGKIKVEVTGRGAVDFEIIVPQSSNLDLLCYKCTIAVTNVSGSVSVRNTDGQIVVNSVRSSRVDAHSVKGNINFTGEILPAGNYTLKSFSGRLDATLPATADFKLTAASYRGGIDLGGLPLRFDKQSDQLVEGALGAGKASVSLWTQEGSIHLHRKP